MSERQEVEQAAIRLLASREHSELELRRKLSSRCEASGVIEQVLQDLRSRGLQSDERFAEQYVSSRKRKGYGPARIRRELQERGLADGLIEAWVDERDGEWYQLLQAAHQRKFGASAPGDFKARAKRARFLEYRGFPAELIRRLLWAE